MDVQILETVYLIVGLDITGEVVGVSECRMLVEESNRILRSDRVRGVLP